MKTFSNCNGFDDFGKNDKIGSKPIFIIILLYFAFFQKNEKTFQNYHAYWVSGFLIFCKKCLKPNENEMFAMFLSLSVKINLNLLISC